MWKVIWWVGKIHPRNEKYLMILSVPHRLTRSSVLTLMYTCMKYIAGFLLVVEYSLAVPPAVWGKKQCHCKELFPVRCWTIGILLSVRRTWPCKISLVLPFAHPHICLSPLPDSVKFLFHIKLDTYHHSIRHSLCPYVIITGITNITHIRTNRIINSLIIPTIKIIVLDVLKSLCYIIFFYAYFHKHISIFLSLELICHAASP